MQNKRLTFKRLTQLFVGLIFFGLGIGLMVRAAIGIPPWDVLAQGISMATGFEFGYVTIVLGFLILLIWIPIKQKMGFGTVMNVIIVGLGAQFVLDFVPEQDSLLVRSIIFAVGIIFVAGATGMYIGASYGPGPRDGLMTGFHALTGKPIWIVRTTIEVSVLLLGWALGGNVGAGTLIFALFIGPLSQGPMKWFDLTDEIEASKK